MCLAGFVTLPAETAEPRVAGRVAAVVEATDPVLVGAGDVAGCDSSKDEATGKLLDSIPGTVFIAGDSVYEKGTATEFANCFGPAWGRHKARIRPAIGDHEIMTPNATPYFNYFGVAAGPVPTAYYSYDLGAWHIVVLNGQCSFVPGGCGANSPQVQWLRNDLSSTTAECIAAVWHRPRFSSGSRTHGYDAAFNPFWDTLRSFGADVVLNGHSHLYERFALQDTAGKADPNGIRQFTVGTGGRGLEPFGTAMPNSEFRYRDDAGVLKLTLHAASYDWQFIRATGAAVVDSGTTGCHSSALDTNITSGPQGATTSTDATFGFGSTKAGSTFECDLDGAGFAPCTSPQTYTGVPLATHTFSVRAAFGGETDASPATRTWTVVPVPPPPPQPVTVGPEADARVVQGSPNANFGAQSALEADNSPLVESYLRFNVAGVSGTVTRARLRLYATDPTGNGPALYRADPTAIWTEAGITWNTKPARTGGIRRQPRQHLRQPLRRIRRHRRRPRQRHLHLQPPRRHQRRNRLQLQRSRRQPPPTRHRNRDAASGRQYDLRAGGGRQGGAGQPERQLRRPVGPRSGQFPAGGELPALQRRRRLRHRDPGPPAALCHRPHR